MAATQVRSAFLKEWIDGTTVQRVDRDCDGDENAEAAHSGFAWTLYDHILKLLSTIASTDSHIIPIAEQRSLKDLVGKLFLWGDSFRDGKLESIFDVADDLRESVVGLLTGIGSILISKVVPSSERVAVPSIRNKIGQLSTSLGFLLEKAKLILESDYESDVASDDEGFTPSETDQAPNIILSLKTGIDCLMELLPSMENALLYTCQTSADDEPYRCIEFQVSGPAKTYILNVYDRFAKADSRLVERLGEANWQRHTALRSRLVAQHNKSVDVLSTATIIEEQFVPKSVFKPMSMFHDSGMGTSISTPSSYAATVASHSSFVSSMLDESSGLRVPPTPKQVSQGIPFACEICGHVLRRIKNRVDWKRHVFADLKPYICTFSGCKDEMLTFPTRNHWQEHEFTQHRVEKSWRCSECLRELSSPELWRTHLKECHQAVFNESQFDVASKMAEQRRPLPIDSQHCPLCLCVPGKSSRNFATHLGKHMEGIALAALPRNLSVDSDSDAESLEGTLASDLEDHQVAEPMEWTPRSTSNAIPEGDEHFRYGFDEAGERKIDSTGYLLQTREYRCRTFYLPNRGDRLFMLATQCARVLGYKDSFSFFQENNSLTRIFTTEAEAGDLIRRKLLPASYQSRVVAVVTAKSIFRQFGSRIIRNGRRVRDDYWEEKAIKQGFSEEDFADASNHLYSSSKDGQQNLMAELVTEDPVNTAFGRDSENLACYDEYEEGESVDVGVQRGAGLFRCQHFNPTSGRCEETFKNSQDLETHFRVYHFPIARASLSHVCSNCYDVNVILAECCRKCKSPDIETWMRGSFPGILPHPEESFDPITLQTSSRKDSGRLIALGVQRTDKEFHCQHFVSGCQERFDNPSKLEAHLQSEHSAFPASKSYVCANCHDVSSFRRFSCDQCKSDHIETWIYGKTIDVTKPSQLDTTSSCTDCGEAFLTPNDLQRHNCIRHLPNQKKYSCPYCKKYDAPNGFTREDHLIEHVRNYHHIDASKESRSAETWLRNSTGTDRSLPILPENTSSIENKSVPGNDLADTSNRQASKKSSLLNKGYNADVEDIIIKCICSVHHDDGDTVYCEMCSTWQHNRCYYFGHIEETKWEGFNHFCVDCNPRRIDKQGAADRQQTQQESAFVDGENSHLIKKAGLKHNPIIGEQDLAQDVITQLRKENIQYPSDPSQVSMTDEFERSIRHQDKSQTASPFRSPSFSFQDTAPLGGLFSDGTWKCDCEGRPPARHLQVQKEGLNKGRWFFTCRKPTYEGCSFFKWDGQATQPESLQTTMNEAAPEELPEKKHICPYCPTEFTRHHNLASHLLTHSQEKAYICQNCNARFRRLHDLKRHMRLHSGEKPHVCPRCDRQFARGDSLARHTRRQGGCTGRRTSQSNEVDDDDDSDDNDGDNHDVSGSHTHLEQPFQGTLKPENKRASSILCFTCGEPGHWDSSCPTKNLRDSKDKSQKTA